MKLSTRVRYALRAAVELALRRAFVGEGGATSFVSLAQVAKRQGIAVPYLRQIFVSLRRNGIVKAAHGCAGGYTLARAPEAISAYDVLAAMGERLGPVDCVSKPSSCARAKECPTHPLWCHLADLQREALEAASLAQLADRCPRRGKESLPRGHVFEI
jgi:Rrf2 family protein